MPTAAPVDPAAAAEALVGCFVPGVTPGKWQQNYEQRYIRRSLTLVPTPQDTAIARLRDGSAHLAFLRDATADDEFHVISLYRELTVVVAARDHPVRAFETLSVADLADETLLTGQDTATLDLVAAGAGVALMPMSVARAFSRRDIVARPVPDAPDTGVGLVWLVASTHPARDDFIGVVRGRTQNSSR